MRQARLGLFEQHGSKSSQEPIKRLAEMDGGWAFEQGFCRELLPRLGPSISGVAFWGVSLRVLQTRTLVRFIKVACTHARRNSWTDLFLARFFQGCDVQDGSSNRWGGMAEIQPAGVGTLVCDLV